MPLTSVWSIDYDSDAKTAKWFWTPKGTIGGRPDGTGFPAGVPASVLRSTVDGTSCIDINIGDDTPGAIYYSKAEMDADGSKPNGTVAFCYDPDSTKFGRYVRTTGTWGTRTTTAIAPPLDDDENHRRTMQIQLMLQSWAASSPDGASDASRLGLIFGRTDLRNYVWRRRMRAIGMSMGEYTKIGQHMQTYVPSQAPAGRPTQNVPFVNCMNKAMCISDALGFGRNGVAGPNAVDYVADSGWVDIDIPLLPKDSCWIPMGGLPTKMGRPGDSNYFRYTVADPNVWLANFTGNAYLCAFKMNASPGTDMAVIPNGEAVKGRLLVARDELLQIS